MSFFDSEIVKAEMIDIDTLQKDIHKTFFSFPFMSPNEKKFHIHLLEKLIEKQQLFYTRLSLSDDPKAIEMKEKVINSLIEMGFSKSTDINEFFSNTKNTLNQIKEKLDKESYSS